MANFCPQCGAPLTPTSKFCPQCGAKIAAAVLQEAALNADAPSGSSHSTYGRGTSTCTAAGYGNIKRGIRFSSFYHTAVPPEAQKCGRLSANAARRPHH